MTDFDYEDDGYKAFIAGNGGKDEKKGIWKAIVGFFVAMFASIGAYIFYRDRGQRLGATDTDINSLGKGLDDIEGTASSLDTITGEIGASIFDVGREIQSSKAICGDTTDTIQRLEGELTQFQSILHKYGKEE